MIHTRLESLIDEMLDGHILLDEAICEFEKLYIKKALARHKQHLSKTAVVLGMARLLFIGVLLKWAYPERT